MMMDDETGWKWWAGTNEEWYTVGPCATRQSAIDEMIDDRSGEFLDDSVEPPRWRHRMHIAEARQDPLRLADWIGADWILERADEALVDGDRVCDDGPWFKATSEQEADLVARLKKACDEWQEAHGLVFTSTTFSHQRNCENIVVEAPEIEGAAQ